MKIKNGQNKISSEKNKNKKVVTKKAYRKYKIKILLPEQKTVQIKKNGRPVRNITVRRKTIKFTDRWAREF